MKRSKLFLSLSTVALMSLCSCQSNLKGAYVFMHKQSGNAYGMSVYKGVSEYLDRSEINIKHADKSPSEQAVSNQVQMIENAAMLGAKAVIVSSSGEVGYDNVLKRVTEKGMKIVSVDSPISPKYRTMHVDQCDPQAIGSFIARSSVCIAVAQRLKEDHRETEAYELAEYPRGETDDEYAEQKLIDLTKKAITLAGDLKDNNRIHIAIITSTAASPSQNEWIAAMKNEFAPGGQGEKDNIDYKGIVDTDWMANHIPLGLDESVESTNKANALIEGVDKERCDVIANVTSVACAACGEALTVHYKTDEKYKHVKMTGTGMPSEMWTYMPDGDDGDDVHALDFPCPYAVLWKVPDMGYVAAQVAYRALNEEGFDPTIEQEYELSDGTIKSVIPVVNPKDGSLKLQPLDPLPFYRHNIDNWKTQF